MMYHSSELENNSYVANIFSKLLLVGLLLLLIQFIYGRRKLYLLSLQIPGPFSWPFVGNGFIFLGGTSNIVSTTSALFEEYGTCFRLWLGYHLFYFTSDPDDIQTILSAELSKAILYDTLKPIVGDGLFTASYPIWKVNRKVLSPAFNQQILVSFVEVFSRNSQRLVDAFSKIAGKPRVDIADHITACALQTTCESTMDVDDPDVDYFKLGKCFDRSAEISFLKMFRPWYFIEPIFRLSSLHTELHDLFGNVTRFASEVIKNRKIKYLNEKQNLYCDGNLSSRRKTFLELMVDLNDKGTFPEKQINNEVKTLLFAASDTSGSLISFCCILLGIYQDVQEKAYKEIMEVVGPTKTIEYADLLKLKYLEQVVNETLRAFPVAPYIGREIKSNIKLKNCTLPSGSKAFIDVLTMHRNPTLWENPLHFDPDRFAPENIAKIHPGSFLPFGGGPRNCLGRKYAMMSIKTNMAYIIRNYKLKSYVKSVADIEFYAHITLKMKGGFICDLEKRKL